MLSSFLFAGYQDVRTRSVSDLAWFPALLGVGVLLGGDPDHALIVLFQMGLFVGLGIGFLLLASVSRGITALGQADVIAIPFLASNPNPIYFFVLTILTGASAVVILAFYWLTGRLRRHHDIPLAQFLTEQNWVPKAVVKGNERVNLSNDVNVSREEVAKVAVEGDRVEVEYGVPQVAFFAAGYVAFVVYLIIFQTAFFFSFP